MEASTPLVLALSPSSCCRCPRLLLCGVALVSFSFPNILFSPNREEMLLNSTTNVHFSPASFRFSCDRRHRRRRTSGRGDTKQRKQSTRCNTHYGRARVHWPFANTPQHQHTNTPTTQQHINTNSISFGKTNIRLHPTSRASRRLHNTTPPLRLRLQGLPFTQCHHNIHRPRRPRRSCTPSTSCTSCIMRHPAYVVRHPFPRTGTHADVTNHVTASPH